MAQVLLVKLILCNRNHVNVDSSNSDWFLLPSAILLFQNYDLHFFVLLVRGIAPGDALCVTRAIPETLTAATRRRSRLPPTRPHVGERG